MLSARRDTTFLLVGDVLLLIAALWIALTLRNLSFPSQAYFAEHLFAFIGVFAVSILIFFIAGLYERQIRLVKHILGSRIIGAQAGNTLLAAVIFFLLPLTIAPKTILALYLIISVLLISLWRFFVAPTLSFARRESALLIGSGPWAEKMYDDVNTQPKYYIVFDGWLDPQILGAGKLHEAVRTALTHDVQLVVIDSRDPVVREELPALYDLMLSGVRFVEFSVLYERLYDRVPLEHIDHAWLLENLPRRNLPYAITKRVIDVVGAAVGMVLAAPLIIIAALAFLFLGGQPFIFHERVGQGGKRFHMVKLRSMLMNDHGDPELQKKNRVTKFGKFLRKTRIDELPQLWNVLQGDLSFIGPRPELPSIVAIYEREIPYYDVRHLIAPGLSGWAQIYDYDAPRGAADIERTRRKLSFDLYYLKHRSIGLDIAIALKTVRALASFSGT